MPKFAITLLLLLIATLPAPAELPYAAQGLSAEEAAAHLLNRFSFGPRPGEVEKVAQMGLERWFQQQLEAEQPDRRLEEALAKLPGLNLSVEEAAKLYVPPGRLRRMAEQEGRRLPDRQDRKATREFVQKYMEEKGYRPVRERMAVLLAQKLLRANYSSNQVSEVMTDFWFNHFNVSLTDNQARNYVLNYEAEAIRPHALGNFRQLLGATAKHPAMLTYLDNFRSSANPDSTTTSEMMMDELPAGPRRDQAKKRLKRRNKGVNENYARELMELHTLGVDGGYQQKDVEELARILTGWTMVPPFRGKGMERMLEQGEKIGVRWQGSFLFAAPMHDAGSKSFLGQSFPAGGGIEEGERALDLLAAHPATAKHLGRKLATRFVSDEPSAALVDHLAAEFLSSQGDIKKVLLKLVQSDEFWRNRRQKIKSPFELVISSSRALAADFMPTKQVHDWLLEMGQPLYAYQAPTGYPDRADAWINSGTLLTRMNFGLQLGLGQIPGLSYSTSWLDLASHERERALEELGSRLLPGRDLEPTVKLLKETTLESDQDEGPQAKPSRGGPNFGNGLRQFRAQPMRLSRHQEPAARVLGLLLGSPEFQRR